MDNRRKILFISIIAFVVLSIGAIIFVSVWKATHNATLFLLYAPSTATATLDGNISVKSGSNALKPGTYTLTIKKDGFETSTQTVEVKGNAEASALACLTSNDPSTADWYLDNDEDAKLCDQVSATGVQRESDYIENNFPIARQLPISGFDYKMDYIESPTRKKEFALTIVYYDAEGKQNALNALEFLGYNPSDFEIIYTDKTSN